MKRNDFFILSMLSVKLTKHKFVNEIIQEHGHPCVDIDTWEAPYQTVLGVLITVNGSYLKLCFANFRSVKGATNDFEDDDSYNTFQANAYRDAFESVAEKTPGLNNLKFLVDCNGLPTIDANCEIFIPPKITGKFYQYVALNIIDVFDKLDAAMPEIEELGGQLYDERKKSIVKKRRPYES